MRLLDSSLPPRTGGACIVMIVVSAMILLFGSILIVEAVRQSIDAFLLSAGVIFVTLAVIGLVVGGIKLRRLIRNRSLP